VFRPPPCRQLRPHLGEIISVYSSDQGADEIAFTITPAARLSDCKSDETAGFTLGLRPADWLTPWRLLTLRSGAAISHDTWVCYSALRRLPKWDVHPLEKNTKSPTAFCRCRSRRTSGLRNTLGKACGRNSTVGPTLSANTPRCARSVYGARRLRHEACSHGERARVPSTPPDFSGRSVCCRSPRPKARRRVLRPRERARVRRPTRLLPSLGLRLRRRRAVPEPWFQRPCTMRPVHR
jgi:hypothetical protein